MLELEEAEKCEEEERVRRETEERERREAEEREQREAEERVQREAEEHERVEAERQSMVIDHDFEQELREYEDSLVLLSLLTTSRLLSRLLGVEVDVPSPVKRGRKKKMEAGSSTGPGTVEGDSCVHCLNTSRVCEWKT